MNMTPKELLRKLQQNGWHKVKQEGSHIKLRKERLPRHNPSYAQQRYGQGITY